MSVCINHIWEKFSGPLKNFIRKRIPNEQDVDDVLQEVFLKIHANIENLSDDQKMYAWIYRITRNAIADYYRRIEKSVDLLESPEDLAIGHDEDINQNVEIAACLKSMIDSLPEKYKEAVLLTEFQNLTQKELSERMGLSLSGAKSRVQRGREKLKEMLLGCCHLEFDRLGNVIDYKHKSSGCKYC
ncbi:RNA polymerase sigma factor SigZ [Heliomicrobium modesticaldum]|uniref:RNA polymerase sigma factor SigZ n=1 Tax=Heliomicrobium modesticaldum TaxID=35701 RepID=UPI001F18FF1F|nr:RNA polymerase sigma factor SigZ [Heliomicrobium modesticaldum]